MKFTTQFPKKDGYHYFVDTEYPQPKIAFFFARGGKRCMQPIGNVTMELQNYHFQHFRFGEVVPLPECTEVEIVD